MLLVWGANPLASHPPRGEEIVRAKRERGARLIVVDPRRTTLAAMADLWLQVRPGTDVALALGMINVIIEEKLYDKEFVDKWCYGFEELVPAGRKNLRPPDVAQITWISAEGIQGRGQAICYHPTGRPAPPHRGRA